MIVETQAVGPFFKNGFVVGCETTSEAVLIDPGDEVASLLTFAERRGLAIRHILLTHAHIDHITGVGAAKDALDVPVFLHKDDLFLYDAVVQQGEMLGFKVRQQPPIDVFYDMQPHPAVPISFGDYEVRLHHTPGHCPGGVCLQIGKKGLAGGGRDLFVGDTLFAGSIGRTDLPGGDYATLMRSITEVLFPLGDDAVVHPGHGPDTTIGREKASNPFVVEYLAARDH
jgi:hydroxyacylglutathione hydrolase